MHVQATKVDVSPCYLSSCASRFLGHNCGIPRAFRGCVYRHCQVTGKQERNRTSRNHCVVTNPEYSSMCAFISDLAKAAQTYLGPRNLCCLPEVSHIILWEGYKTDIYVTRNIMNELALVNKVAVLCVVLGGLPSSPDLVRGI